MRSVGLVLIAIGCLVIYLGLYGKMSDAIGALLGKGLPTGGNSSKGFGPAPNTPPGAAPHFQNGFSISPWGTG
jgi:hypothetical protein